MRKTKNTGRDSLRRLPWYKLTDAGTNFCNAYAQLAVPDRRKVLDILLEHAFLPNGTDSYRWFQKKNIVKLRTSQRQFLEISAKMNTVWNAWAREINKTRASQVACREAILGLVSNLVRQNRSDVDVYVIGLPTQGCTAKQYEIKPLEASVSVDGARRSTVGEATIDE